MEPRGQPICPKLTVILEVDSAHLRILEQASASIVIAKPMARGTTNVAWLAWRPLERNTIIWEETYGIYAARGSPAPEHSIRIDYSVFPAVDRIVYSFAGPCLGRPVSDLEIPRGHFEIRNVSSEPATIGLLQAATINGKLVLSPVNAVVVPHEFTADFAAVTKSLMVWTQPGVVSGMLIPAPASATSMNFDDGIRVKRYQYDGRNVVAAPLDTNAVNGSPKWGS